ncbi:FAD-binding dehydrogenase [Thermus thermophilus]|uniref:FAD-binding dehydrogenase n=1 Tax=Thermus thermophilus TaxID=274 RepID=A0AAD1KT40_THETH|nr:FAD-binding dehydrogenase [Thermus thermophilus]BBL81632.1 FAD-binding dehydrogenase [Thermus thermophilus]BBL83935.1 FAD-binding dehydrogenase [Thermus thermophilus]BCZ86239.1 FAD-binding dehydrogenase [Thermus thermophilus]BCZ88634.1 FAD-binding dehydrogenase [Thermus thermophilus]BCZ91260.1 FAD-binding dehydrogenase [Thermus thermophilus]
MDADLVVVGGGLAGLVVATEVAQRGKRVLLLEQEPYLGGQAFWSFGGLFLVDSPEQRRLGIRDSVELAFQDWMGAAGYDREEDAWGRRFAEAYLEFAAGEKRAWLASLGVRFFPVVGWAERGGGLATGHGNSVPRFHIVWGTGPGILAPFLRKVEALQAEGTLRVLLRHRVEEVLVEGGKAVGVAGAVLEEDPKPRGAPTSRKAVGGFRFLAQAVVLATGGIGANLDLVRRHWPARMGRPPERMLSGVPDHVDGSGLFLAERAGARLVNLDRMWHYPEGVENHTPVWTHHGIRILPGPSPLWVDATGKRLPPPLFPGFDALETLRYLRSTGFDWSWFILDLATLKKEFALSGSEQNPDLTGRSWFGVVRNRLLGPAAPVRAFLERGKDFLVAQDLSELMRKMEALAPGVLDPGRLEREVKARDRELLNPFAKDGQVLMVHAFRRYVGDRLFRVAKPHPFLSGKGPLVAVRLWTLTRKTLGGIQTDLKGRALKPSGEPLPGLFAVGEAAGFGGGAFHGYKALEGTFLGGCLFSGLQAAKGVLEGLE